MATFKIQPTHLSGTVTAQPSKSMAHRAVICAALACGTSVINNLVLSDDITATLGAVKALGAECRVEESQSFKGRKCITVLSQGKAVIREKVIDCMESGSTARFMMPVTRLSPDQISFVGHGRLVERPFELYRDLFTQKGIKYEDHQGKMPITLSGKLTAGVYELPGDISSQFVSGLLFALPLLEEPSKIVMTSRLESLPYVKMTIQALDDFGIHIICSNDYDFFEIPGNQSYKATHYTVEGDWSQAAFFCVMGALSGPVTIQGLSAASLQGDKVILDILKGMGAKAFCDERGITFYKSELKGMDVDVSQCPDLVPAIAAAASAANGMTHIKNAARLRIKESDRLLTTCRELNALGAAITEEQDGLTIHGASVLNGGLADGSGDHRIVMALASVSSVCKERVSIEGCEAVNKSYPRFWEDFAVLGGRVEK